MGARKKYNEKTVMLSFRVPESKVDEFKKIANEKLMTWQKSKGNIKWSKQDEHFLADRKYTIKKVRGASHVCRSVESSRGKFNVLLAQDIIGINCQIRFVDGNTLNNERENIKPVSVDVEYFY